LQLENTYEKIYATVGKVPKGKVATYGQIAHLCGIPTQARQVGYALAALKRNPKNIPWQRIVNAQGKTFADKQQALLEEEGIVIQKGSVDLKRYQWSLR
jgi:methylated-DNA-protein-cysteine methyltransferase-like protein